MAGGAVKYRHLSRDSAHRKALLRNLVTSLFQHETISTTWAKAKEAQRLADKLVTLAKKNTSASRRRAHQIFFRPIEMVPKLFGPIRERYADRPGGYTRVLRIEPIKEDQAPSAILELVDGPKDMRFAITAQTAARERMMGVESHPMTKTNMRKVTRFRQNGRQQLEKMIHKFMKMETSGEEGTTAVRKETIYEKRRYYMRSRHAFGRTIESYYERPRTRIEQAKKKMKFDMGID